MFSNIFGRFGGPTGGGVRCARSPGWSTAAAGCARFRTLSDASAAVLPLVFGNSGARVRKTGGICVRRAKRIRKIA
eukprot:661525-Pyramimonas_sp.AAC.1